MKHLFQLFANKFVKTPKRGDLFEKLRVLAKSMIFRLFSWNQALFATFFWKVRQNAETWWFAQKVESFWKIDEFSCFITKWGTFCNFVLKNSCKRRNMVLCSKGWQFWPNERFFVFFQDIKHFLLLFSEKFMVTPKNRSFFEKLSVLFNSIIFRVFLRNEARFPAFCQKVRKNA